MMKEMKSVYVNMNTWAEKGSPHPAGGSSFQFGDGLHALSTLGCTLMSYMM
jgi:hypothetical protein